MLNFQWISTAAMITSIIVLLYCESILNRFLRKLFYQIITWEYFTAIFVQTTFLTFICCFIYRRTGTSLTLMTRQDWRNAPHLIEILVEAMQVRTFGKIRVIPEWEAWLYILADLSWSHVIILWPSIFPRKTGIYKWNESYIPHVK